MKKYSILALVLVLTALSLAGCRNPNMRPEPTAAPTTQATTTPTIAPTTEATHAPTEYTEHTQTGTNATEHTEVTVHPSESATDTTAATGEGRARQIPRSR